MLTSATVDIFQMEKFVAAKCLTIPTDLSGLTCANISSSFGPLLEYAGSNFWTDLPSEVLCDPACMAIFKQVDLPSNVVHTNVIQ